MLIYDIKHNMDNTIPNNEIPHPEWIGWDDNKMECMDDSKKDELPKISCSECGKTTTMKTHHKVAIIILLLIIMLLCYVYREKLMKMF